MQQAERAQTRRNAGADVARGAVDGELAADVPQTGGMEGVRTAGMRAAQREAQRHAADRAEPTAHRGDAHRGENGGGGASVRREVCE